MGEQDKRLAFQGPRGEQGQQGDRGEQGTAGAPGLSHPVPGRAVVWMFGFAVVLAVVGLFWINHEVHVTSAAIQSGRQREQVSQQRDGAMLELRLCTTFGKLAALKPPAGNPKTNPSRAFDDNLHDTLDQLGTDLGCKQKVS
jgi:hypothetical protein